MEHRGVGGCAFEKWTATTHGPKTERFACVRRVTTPRRVYCRIGREFFCGLAGIGFLGKGNAEGIALTLG